MKPSYRSKKREAGVNGRPAARKKKRSSLVQLRKEGGGKKAVRDATPLFAGANNNAGGVSETINFSRCVAPMAAEETRRWEREDGEAVPTDGSAKWFERHGTGSAIATDIGRPVCNCGGLRKAVQLLGHTLRVGSVSVVWRFLVCGGVDVAPNA